MKKITKQELTLAAIFAVLGFAFSSREWLLYLNGLDPLAGLAVYYAILFAAVMVLSRLGLVINKFKIKNVSQVAGLMLITFAFFILVGFSSQYTQFVTQGSMAGASTIFYQCEDGAVFYFWNTTQGISDVEQARLLTYVFTPFALALAGGFLATKTRLGI